MLLFLKVFLADVIYMVFSYKIEEERKIWNEKTYFVDAFMHHVVCYNPADDGFC